MVLTSEFVAAHPELLGKQSPAEMPTLDTSGTLRSASVVRVPTLQLGNHTLQGVVATIAPPAAGGAGAKLAGVIGGGILSRFDVVIDLPRGWLTLTPNAYYAAPFEADMSGMLVVTTRIAGQAGEPSGEVVYTVAGISKNSPAADSGLQIGDRLIEVAGQRVKDMSLDLVRKALMSGPGKKLLLTIDRSGMKIKLTLTLQRAV
jgi:S1-C subfamily serine protease